ncbi:LysR family transcriptional regulator, partial [Microvirga tunisiensis]|nr:LysR family transcriptional regulator [Microvirga tunisiensis]MPR31464.1 LysR family transcriptional regulator [Microvirga tunisiensis]
PFTEAVQWPAFHNTDPASIWMREMLLQEASLMTSPCEPIGHLMETRARAAKPRP